MRPSRYKGSAFKGMRKRKQIHRMAFNIKKSDSFHENYGREEVNKSSDRGFGIVMAVAFAVVALWPVAFGNDPRLWALGIAALFLIVAFTFSWMLAPLNKIWFYFGLAIAKVMNPLIMGLMFFGIITPAAYLRRWLGGSALSMNYDEKAQSYWITRTPPGPEPETLKDQF